MKRKAILITIFAVLISPVFGQEYIKVTEQIADIRFSPSATSDLVAQATLSNIFEVKNDEQEWYGILMFSGEYRYILKSDCEKTDETFKLTDNEQQKKAAFIELGIVEGKAQADADKKFPTDIIKNIDYFRMLCDKYDLEIMNKYEFQPPTYRDLILEGVKKKW